MNSNKKIFITILAVCAACAEVDDQGETSEPLVKLNLPGPGSPPINPAGTLDPLPQLIAPFRPNLEVRECDRIRIGYRDRTDLETAYAVQRRVGETGPYLTVDNFGPLPRAYYRHTDTTVSAGELYCYRIQVTDGTLTKNSLPRCVFTPAPLPLGVFRAQLRVKVADVSDAGTTDPVRVYLNSPRNIGYDPQGNLTYLDHSRRDLVRGSDYTYDLLPPRDLYDITMISIKKNGTDGLCIESLELVLNKTDRDSGITVFSRYFGSNASTCHWIDGNDGHLPYVGFNAEWMRASTLWPGQTPQWCGGGEIPCEVGMFPVFHETLAHRVEDAIGSAFGALDEAYWRSTTPLNQNIAKFELTRIDEKTMHLHVKATADVSWLIDPNVTLDADISIKTAPQEDDDGTIVTLVVTDAEASVSAHLFYEVVALLLEAIIQADSTVDGEDCYSLVNCMEKVVEHEMEKRVLGVDRQFRLPRVDSVSCVTLKANLTETVAAAMFCDDIDSDGMSNEWEREFGLDPDDASDAVEDPDGDGFTNLQEFQADTDPYCEVAEDHINYCQLCGPCEQCPWPKEHVNYCRDCGPCAAGLGDCDPGQCVDGAVCGEDNGPEYGLPPAYDVCECTLDEGHPDYCDVCGPCIEGKGDCDGDYQCAEGLVCARDVGASFGFDAERDVCICPLNAPCNVVSSGTLGGL